MTQLMIAIALWCGNNTKPYPQVKECRDEIIKCQKNKRFPIEASWECFK